MSIESKSPLASPSPHPRSLLEMIDRARETGFLPQDRIDSGSIHAVKQSILRGMRFNWPITDELRPFGPGEDYPLNFQSVTDYANRDKYVVTMIAAKKDCNNCILHGTPTNQISNKNIQDFIKDNRGSTVRVIRRPPSIDGALSGFDNQPEPIRTNLGGGFRLQFDQAELIDGKVLLKCSFASVFGDGSAKWATETEIDWEKDPNANRKTRVPHFTNSFYLEHKTDKNHPTNDSLNLYSFGQKIPDKLEDAHTTYEFTQYMLNKLLQKDGRALLKLLKTIIDTAPATNQHSIEVLFFTTKDKKDKPKLTLKVIDFDGLSTKEKFIEGTDISDANSKRHPISEMYSTHNMRRFFFPPKISPSDHSLIISNDLQNIDGSLSLINGLIGESNLEKNLEQLKQLVRDLKDDASDEFGFLTLRESHALPVLFGRALQHFDINWTPTTNEFVEEYDVVVDKKKIKLIKLNFIDDMELVLWTEDGKIISPDPGADVKRWLKLNLMEVCETGVTDTLINSLSNCD